MAESNSIDMNATTGDQPDIEIPSSFTNFLRNDDPFFCSWGRDSNANKTETVEKEKSELTDHVPNPITSDKIIGCKEKDNAPETVKPCGLSTGDSNACKNVSTGSNKMDKVNAKECGPSSATPRNLDMGGSGNVLIKVQDLRPKFNDVNLLVKVVNVRKTCRKGQRRVNVCIVGDETATINLRVTNNQVDIVKKGSTLMLYKAKINVMNDSMELMVPEHGNIQVQQESATFTVKEDNNMSIIEYHVFQLRA